MTEILIFILSLFGNPSNPYPDNQKLPMGDGQPLVEVARKNTVQKNSYTGEGMDEME